MAGTESFITVRVEDWQPVKIIGRDGKEYRVEGECDTSRCNAVCCRIANYYGEVGTGPCQFLDTDNKCIPHKDRGPACKPVSCWLWPKQQIDIDGVNALAEREGMPWRCHLRVVEWRS